MATKKSIITALFIATATNAYADEYNDYQSVEARAEANNAYVSQSVDNQQMQDRMNQMQQPTYQQPQVEYQSTPTTTNTMYGTMYTGPGSGYPQQ